jgi:potassium channel subfamily K
VWIGEILVLVLRGGLWMADDGELPSSTGRSRLRVAFSDNSMFHPIPEDGVCTRPISVSRSGNLVTPLLGAWNREEAVLSPPKSSWTSSLEASNLARGLKNSFTLGFLFPDDGDDSSDDLREALQSDSDEEERDERKGLLAQNESRSYGTWGSQAESLDKTGSRDLESCGRVRLPSAKSLPSFAAALLDADVKVGKSVPEEKHLLHRCQTAPAMSSMCKERKAVEKLKRPEFEKGSAIVTQAGIGLMIYLAFGVAIYAWKRQEFSGIETFSVVDALYFCVVTMCTIGYGDIVPQTTFAKLFSCLFVLIGFGFIDALLSGMVTYVLDKQEHLLLSAVEGSHFRTAKKYFLNAKHGNRMRIRMKVGMALVLPIMCILVGTSVMMKFEQLPALDAFYCTIMSITTVGYGDHTFKTYSGRLFAGLWLLFSTLAVARCFLYLAEARVDKRHRLIAKWVLQRQLTVGDLVQADLDHDGSIR